VTFVTVLVWVLIIAVPIWVVLLLTEFADADLPWRRWRRKGDPPPSEPPDG
jgi:hypothetical protein